MHRAYRRDTNYMLKQPNYSMSSVIFRNLYFSMYVSSPNPYPHLPWYLYIRRHWKRQKYAFKSFMVHGTVIPSSGKCADIVFPLHQSISTEEKEMIQINLISSPSLRERFIQFGSIPEPCYSSCHLLCCS